MMVSILVKLVTTFFRIGLLTIGGGLVVIPLIQAEMLSRGWLTTSQFLDIVGIAQATPGPMGVNTATFVGYRVFETQGYSCWIALMGALAATMAVSAPSVICVHFGGGWFERNREKSWMKRFFAVLRPIVAIIVTYAGASLTLECLSETVRTSSISSTIISIALMIVAMVTTITRRISPLWALLLGAAVGAAFI